MSEHERDVATLQTLAELCPAMKRVLSHTLRNKLGSIGIAAELMRDAKTDEQRMEMHGLLNGAYKELMETLEQVGL